MNERLDSAMQQLADEQRRLKSLRADYNVIMRSRFHGLRVLWFALKHVLMGGSPKDLYAAWSPALEPLSVTSPVLEHKPKHEPQYEEDRLIKSWLERIARQPLSDEPVVTVVIPAYNQCQATVRCLQSLADTWFESLAVQIVFVDDGSSDQTCELITSLPGIDYLRNGVNQGFIRSCNRGAAIARGRYICFLNNDTELSDGWLDHLVTGAEADPMVGAVGAKLVYPNGKLQEAGAIIWRDGSGWNYGRGDDPADPRYNYTREADYCSAAALLVRADLFRTLGGFSERYLPAYYEDTDLCFAIRSLGYRVIYEPRSVVVHHEGVTSGKDTSAGMKRFQPVNESKFSQAWSLALREHFANDPARVPFAARRIRHDRTVLVVDSYVPLYDKESGSNRLLRILKVMRAAGYQVIFLPDNYAGLQPYTTELQALGIEVLYCTENGRPMEEALGEVLPILDVAWVCRPELFMKYRPLIQVNRATKFVYDTIDLHFVRKKHERDVLGGAPDQWRETQALELQAARSADVTVTVTEGEKAVLESHGIRNVYCVPNIHEVEFREERSFDRSEGLLFIGSYNHPPNIDSVKWLCSKIMPVVWKRLPAVELTLLGSNPNDEVRALASQRVHVPGYRHDVAGYFLQSRLFLAPLRFGAGLKGKIGQSLSYGLPVVTTSVGAEGFELEHGRDCWLAEDPQSFAEGIVRLYTDPVLWQRLSANSLKAVERFQSSVVGPKALRVLADVVSKGSRVLAEA